tara:strand:+ start:933 stop:1103 length:171 start_codon:yes stop_codon:yes gene_type:complete
MRRSITDQINVGNRLAELEVERRDLEEMRVQFDFEHRRDDDGIDEVKSVLTMSEVL